MTKQFDTFDNVADRKELIILFERLGDGLPDYKAKALRARWLESLIRKSLTMPAAPLQVSPDSCSPVGAYFLLVQITGVLGVPIREAAKQLDQYVSKGAWRET